MDAVIALLRGINVGGKNKLRMADLTDLLMELGLHHIKTYIQSGNVLFQCREDLDLADLSAQISQAIAAQHGFTPHVLLLTGQAVNEAVAQNPFPNAEAEPKSLHLFFLADTPKKPDLAALENLKASTEQYALTDRVFYLYAPDGIGRSKLATRAERILGVPATARNWRTVSKLVDLAANPEA